MQHNVEWKKSLTGTKGQRGNTSLRTKHQKILLTAAIHYGGSKKGEADQHANSA
jgi:hypothetical protein